MQQRTLSSRALRVAAALTVLLGLSLVNQLPTVPTEAGYLGVLTGVGAVLALLSGLRLWFAGCCVSRTLAASVSLATVGAQLLERYVGLPGRGSPDGSSDPMLAVVLALAAAVVTLLVLDTRLRADGRSQSSPYALLP